MEEEYNLVRRIDEIERCIDTCIWYFKISEDVDKQVDMFKSVLTTIQQYKATSVPQEIAEGIQNSLSMVMSLRVSILLIFLHVVFEE